MNGIHTIWTVPKGGTVFKNEYELLTTVLSALEWRKHNGRITLFTDKPNFFEKSGLYSVWNEIKSLEIPSPPDPEIFWAAGKIYTMKHLNIPFCMIDNDFIVWKPLDFHKITLAAVHNEELSEDVYPNFNIFFENTDYNKNVLPVNTAFTYINNKEFLNLYTSEAIKIMKNFPKSDDRLCPMVFAEQRLFSMCAEKLGLQIKLLSDLQTLFKNGADGQFTHIWGFKRQMDENDELKKDYIKKVLFRIDHEFGEFSETVRKGLCHDF